MAAAARRLRNRVSGKAKVGESVRVALQNYESKSARKAQAQKRRAEPFQVLRKNVLML